MKLKSFGCSFIWGCDLPDETYTQFSRLSWPARLAKQLNLDYECFAKPGSGNLQILEQVLNQSATDSNDLYVIGWTWVDRFDYTTEQGWETLVPVDTSQEAKMYYKKLHSEYRDKLASLSYIKLAIDTLNQKKIPFIMTYMDDLIFDQRWNTSAAVVDLQQYVQPFTIQFDGQTFLNWSRGHGFAESVTWHPLAQAHKAASDYMFKVVDKQKIIDPAR